MAMMSEEKQKFRENLEQRGLRWKKAMSDAATGPLVIAKEIVELSEEWPSVKDEADGLSCSGWLRRTFSGNWGLSFFKLRHQAVVKLGEASRRTLHHEVAVWVTKNVPDVYIDQVKFMLIRECKERGNNPLRPAMAIPKIKEIVGKSGGSRPRACRKCDRLEQLLRANGVAF